MRIFAAQHAAAHAKAATVRPNAWCHCGSQRCASHPDTRAHCAGGVVLILQHDPVVGRVWTIEEVCETCAPLIPNATAVARAARPKRTTQPTAQTLPAQAPAARPVVPGGFSSAGAGPAESQAAPGRRPRRTSQPPRRQRSGHGH
ncbi:hypothetical protein ACF07Y_46325 [Streptomyces sp. NPDC016566]|uniref:hypothetical protein n=1 Tax=Streptomyces sp. NPDC016566 TaxID=3364967 RepID=UPI0036F70C20